MTWTWTPRLWASSRALAIGASLPGDSSLLSRGNPSDQGQGVCRALLARARQAEWIRAFGLRLGRFGGADVGAFLVGIDYPSYLGSISWASVGAGDGYGHRLRAGATRPVAPRAAYIGVLSGSIVARIVVLPVGVLEARSPDLRARNP
jgi:hypothetical protein